MGEVGGEVTRVHLVDDGPHLRALLAAARKTPVLGDEAPPSLPAARQLRNLFDEPVLGQLPEVVAGQAGAFAQRPRQRGGCDGPTAQLPLDALPQRMREQPQRVEIEGLPGYLHNAKLRLQIVLCKGVLASGLWLREIRADATPHGHGPARGGLINDGAAALAILAIAIEAATATPRSRGS
jgi:hypothetical protein